MLPYLADNIMARFAGLASNILNLSGMFSNIRRYIKIRMLQENNLFFGYIIIKIVTRKLTF